MDQKNYSAVIDLSGVEASFTVAEDVKTPLFVRYKEMRGRSAALLLEWIIECLKKNGIELNQIKNWTVGSGPGSFTGLRMAASLVGGLIFNKSDIKARSLPTALGLAAGVNPNIGEKVAVLFDGRNNELLLFGVVNGQNGLVPDGVTEVMNVDNAEANCSRYDRIVAFEHDRKATEGVLYKGLLEKVEFIEHLPVEKMLKIKTGNWNNDLTDLVYIRQAVFTKPVSV